MLARRSGRSDFWYERFDVMVDDSSLPANVFAGEGTRDTTGSVGLPLLSCFPESGSSDGRKCSFVTFKPPDGRTQLPRDAVVSPNALVRDRF